MLLRLGGSSHESELSFNPERHLKFNLCLHERLKDRSESKFQSGMNVYIGRLHDSESTFHSGTSVRSGMKNEINSVRNEL